MKHIVRIFFYSCFSIFILSYWNKGFILPSTPFDFMRAALILMVLYVIIRPIMKIVFLPFNLLTFGLFSFFVYVLFLHLLSSTFGIFHIQSWQFPGLSLYLVFIPHLHITYFQNLVLSSFSLSSIINLLDQLT